MFGPPKDIDNECNTHLYIAKHGGLHKEVFDRNGKPVHRNEKKEKKIMIGKKNQYTCKECGTKITTIDVTSFMVQCSKEGCHE